MALSALDLFSVGIGPSSSHTVGPMRAAKRFTDGLVRDGQLNAVARVRAELFGSLGATGFGHGSDKAVVLGLQGQDPETVDTDTADAQVRDAIAARKLALAGEHPVPFDWDADVILHRRKALPAHPNGMTFFAYDDAGDLLRERTYYSVGGGFVVDEDAAGADRIVEDATVLPYPFTTGAQLLAHCRAEGLSIAQVMLANELTWRSETDLRSQLLHIWAVMQECVENGCTRTEERLPGGLKVRRRAPELRRKLRQIEVAAATSGSPQSDPLWAMEWVNLYALAVNEENASGGRIVTAPTNGAAGIIPAVLHFYTRFVPGADDDGVVEFLLTAAAVGILFKENASISGAEVGCQGEVGSACSMAAGALCAVLGGTPEQVENAAEVGIEHNLGLTCDPVGGLVQIPCIERNAIASVKAINAARLCLQGDGEHKVSLDQAIKTMRETGKDMKIKYKETSRGGLAVNVIEC
ncbi:L-serine ammonia-lyase [Arthrobacter crystallopoietes]|uniref:L-serine dehydratase n=1 Tax=Crystallibacter crystallopoietes TaxID=37928 RepID=A0A1H1B722_9MICC|nr:L-serine ammonia-lyase [Arthrobacter crystallopoietes]AUI51256.1 L-serine ammonia-lyase [Arthrobacter crystallopoietes]SDQ47683.1 L-serine ammonia-lyase [Arthrobacter crystallopoietes]